MSADALSMLNATGFPFQLAVEHLLHEAPRKGNRDFPWTVWTREHAWRHPITGASGFIDNVLLSRASSLEPTPSVATIEAKRFKAQQPLVFLEPTSPPGGDSTIPVLWVLAAEPSPLFCYVRGGVRGGFERATFCVQPTDQDRQLFERTASEMLIAAEGLAAELATKRLLSTESPCAVVPILATNLRLELVKAPPSSFNISEGKIFDAEVSEVRAIALVKPLRSEFDSYLHSSDIWDHASSLERAVFVVSAPHLVEFLRSLVPIRPPVLKDAIKQLQGYRPI